MSRLNTMLPCIAGVLWISLAVPSRVGAAEIPAAQSGKPEFIQEESSGTSLELFSASQLRQLQRVFSGWDATTGALAEAGPGNGYSRLHEPWKNESGRLLLEYTADMRKGASGTLLSMRVVKNSTGGDGVGISVYADTDARLSFLGRCLIPPAAGEYECSLDLAPIHGRMLQVFLAIDANRNTFADSIAIASVEIRRNDGKALPFIRRRSGMLPEKRLTELELQTSRPDPEPLMAAHLFGRQPGTNVYSARDSRRPMIGAHVYFSENARKRLGCLKDVFDYVTHDGKDEGDRLCELAGMPWVSIYHNPIPVNAYDESRLSKIRHSGEAIAESAPKYAFRLGATSGSEPHFSPDYHYTGHKKEEIDNLMVSPGGARQFGRWMASLYGDATPGEDTSGDGMTFADDFGISAESWEGLSRNIPEAHPDYRYLSTLFKEHVLSEDIKYVDQAYASSGCVITSRLLSPQYDSAFGQSLRQLEIPQSAIGVTYYSTTSNALDPSATQMRFRPSRLYSSEKSYVSAFEMRPPFWQSSGRCYGIFGPFRHAEKLSFELRTSFSAKAELLFAICALDGDGGTEEIFSQRMDGDFSGRFEIGLDRAGQRRYEVSLRSLTPSAMNNNVKAIWVNPEIHAGGKKTPLHECLADAQTGYVLDSAPGKRVPIGLSDSRYSPEITELRGSYIYSQARRRGVRPLYNEFMSGTHLSNTAQNLWRSVFHELQFQPAGIVWFCYGGGSPGSSFSDMDCHYLATELAVLRGQLELLGVYGGIRREKRQLALFLPTAAPFPLKGMRDAEQQIGNQLARFSPDVLLADQTGKCEEYDNLILFAGFMDGKSDRRWNDFLKSIPPGKKVIVIMNEFMYTEPGGRRGSRNFRRSLAEALPLYPEDLPRLNGQIELDGIRLRGKWLPAAMAAECRDGNSAIKLDGAPVAFADGNLLVLSGIPDSGLEELAARFFGIQVPDTRDAGSLHILNRDADVRRPGIYCVDENQTLRLPDGWPAFDLSRRQVVSGTCGRAAVVLVPDPGKLQLVDCGTARPLVRSEGEKCAEVQLHLPKYPFEGDARPELIFHAPGKAQAWCDGKRIEVDALGNGFWKCPVESSGVYRVELQ